MHDPAGVPLSDAWESLLCTHPTLPVCPLGIAAVHPPSQAHEVAAEMLTFYERHATPIPAAEAQRLLDLLGLPQLPYPQQQQQQQQQAAGQQREGQQKQQRAQPPKPRQDRRRGHPNPSAG